MKTTKGYRDMAKKECREVAQAKVRAALDRLGKGVRSV